MHSSRSLFVSGQAQQIFFFFGAFDTSHAADAGAAGAAVTVVGWFEAEEEGAATPFCTCALPIESRMDEEKLKLLREWKI